MQHALAYAPASRPPARNNRSLRMQPVAQALQQTKPAGPPLSRISLGAGFVLR